MLNPSVQHNFWIFAWWPLQQPYPPVYRTDTLWTTRWLLGNYDGRNSGVRQMEQTIRVKHIKYLLYARHRLGGSSANKQNHWIKTLLQIVKSTLNEMSKRPRQNNRGGWPFRKGLSEEVTWSITEREREGSDHGSGWRESITARKNSICQFLGGQNVKEMERKSVQLMGNEQEGEWYRMRTEAPGSNKSDLEAGTWRLSACRRHLKSWEWMRYPEEHGIGKQEGRGPYAQVFSRSPGPLFFRLHKQDAVPFFSLRSLMDSVQSEPTLVVLSESPVLQPTPTPLSSTFRWVSYPHYLGK